MSLAYSVLLLICRTWLKMILNNKINLESILNSGECEFISLGYNCDVAHFLRYSGLRKKAYPFDWCITPTNSIINLFKNNFEDFLNIKNMTFSDPHPASYFEGESKYIIETDKLVVSGYCERYKMLFPHDFPIEDKASYIDVSIKYNERATRLLKLLEGHRKLVFVYKLKDNLEEDIFVKKLNSLLRDKNPKLDFHLISLEYIQAHFKSSLKYNLVKFYNKKYQRFKNFLNIK